MTGCNFSERPPGGWIGERCDEGGGARLEAVSHQLKGEVGDALRINTTNMEVTAQIS